MNYDIRRKRYELLLLVNPVGVVSNYSTVLQERVFILPQVQNLNDLPLFRLG